MSREFEKNNNHYEVADGACGELPQLAMEWANMYWDFYKSTNPKVAVSFEAALEDPVHQLYAEELLARAYNTAELVVSARPQKIGATAIEFTPPQLDTKSELQAA